MTSLEIALLTAAVLLYVLGALMAASYTMLVKLHVVWKMALAWPLFVIAGLLMPPHEEPKKKK